MQPFLQRFRRLRTESRWFRWAADALFLLIVLSVVLAWQTRNLIPGGDPAPAFALFDLSGNRWSLEKLRGKPVVLHFWAPWCGVCKTETGAISSLRKSMGDDAHVISVVLAYEDMEDVRRFVSEEGVDYPVLLGNDALMRDYKVNAFPTTYFLSEDGRIKHASVGLTTGLGLRLRTWF